jgi:hypothetical protein
LKARAAAWLADLETYYHWYGRHDRHVQRFEAIADYQAETQPRRIIAKIEITPQGSNRRFLVTNLPGNETLTDAPKRVFVAGSMGVEKRTGCRRSAHIRISAIGEAFRLGALWLS